MFGNPNLSATPVFDLYNQSQGQYPGAEGLAGYSGQNQGIYPGPQGDIDYGRPTIRQSLNTLNPLTSDPLWGNPYMHQQPAIDSLSSKPMDAAMWGAQRIAAPALAFSLGSKMFGGFSGAYKIGRAFAGGIGVGLGEGLGVGAMATSAMGATAGVAGGVAAGFALPYAAAMIGMKGAEKGIFNPYINTRRSADDLRQNFSGVTLSDTSGQAVTGQGFGGLESAQMASQITQAGIGSMSYSTGEYAAGASMISRSGLTDNVGSKSGIITRIKESMEQVKLIMSISSMPEMKEAIEQLAKLQSAGASVAGGVTSNASTTMMRIGGLASIAGVSVQKLMNTVGAQGQYMYQANGMTPYLGQMAAGNTYASFAAGNRVGLYSSAQLSRMGGAEGAAQSSLAGQITATGSMYNMMGNYNQYIGGQGRGGNMVGTITKFGQDVARDPIGAMGAARMYSKVMQGKQLNEQGSKATEDQVAETARNMHMGNLTAEKAYMILTSPVIGMSDDSAISFLQQVRSESDPRSKNNALKALDADFIKQQSQFVSQNGTYSGAIGDSIYKAKKFGNELTQRVSGAIAEPAAGIVGSMSDYLSTKTQELFFKDSITPKGDTDIEAVRDSIYGKKTAKTDYKDMAKDQLFSSSIGGKVVDSALSLSPTSAIKMFTKSDDEHFSDITDKINKAYLNGDKDAAKIIKGTTTDERSDGLKAMLKSKSLGDYADKKYGSGSVEGFNALSKYTESAKRTDAEDTSQYLGKKAEGAWDSFKNLWDASSIMPSKNKGKTNTDDLSEVDKLRTVGGLMGSGLETNMRALKVAGDILGKSGTGGTLSATSSNEDLKKDKSIQEFMKMYGETDPNKALEKAITLAKTGSSQRVSMIAEDLGQEGGYKFHDKNKEAEYKAALEDGKNTRKSENIKLDDAATYNKGIRRGGDSGALDHTNDEVIGISEISKQFQLSRNRVNDLAKDRKIDFSTSERILQSLDEKENTATFGKYVEDFGKHVSSLGDKKKVDGPSAGGFVEGARDVIEKFNRNNLSDKR